MSKIVHECCGSRGWKHLRSCGKAPTVMTVMTTKTKPKWTSETPPAYGVYWWRKEKSPTFYLLQLLEFGDQKKLHALDLLGHLPNIQGLRVVSEMGGEWLAIELPGKDNEPV